MVCGYRLCCHTGTREPFAGSRDNVRVVPVARATGGLNPSATTPESSGPTRTEAGPNSSCASGTGTTRTLSRPPRESCRPGPGPRGTAWAASGRSRTSRTGTLPMPGDRGIMVQGHVWWANLDEPLGWRPVLILTRGGVRAVNLIPRPTASLFRRPGRPYHGSGSRRFPGGRGSQCLRS
jgi:hypothetical protein